MKTILALALLAASALHAATQISFKRVQLTDKFYAEGAHAADIDKDGHVDIISGPFWYAGPDWKTKNAFYEPKVFDINGYSDNFFVYPHDLTGDGWLDILVLGFPGKEARLYVSPGKFGSADAHWPIHIVADVVDNESPVFTDITGDGKPEIVCSTGGRFGWFAPDWAKPTEKWSFVAASDDMKVAKFTHGLGVGDVNGDGKMDLLEARRWWENTGITISGNHGPEVPAPFTQHNFAAGVGGGAQMFAYDFDGNGTKDVFTALAAHRYGVAVFLQNKPAPDKPTWQRVMLASEQPQDNDYGIVFSQPHAAHHADINGDGIADIVTGKRYWAHNGHDPDERGTRVVYWYETKRDGKGGVDFVPHLADAESGVGTDVQVVDVNADKLPDIVIGNKAGVYVLLQERKDTTADLTPKKMYGPALKPQAEYAKGQSAADALKSMQLPGGFKAELIAAEPDLVQPIAFTFDERGRIWVVEGNSYPKPREVGAGQDRIKILEDKDGDGTFETKKIFCEGLNLVSGIELGFGGVWVGAAPYLMFIPDKDRDDKPDSADLPNPVPGLNFKAQMLLDGWGSQDTHETLNSFIWGPDGWLYGCHGVFTHSRVGKPGTPDDQRQPINAGIWRYHPVRHEFEIFAHGTSNPWGLDYDQHGEFFVTACVIPHLFHIVPGGRYQRQAGQHFNAHTYEDIKTIADHAHYAGSLRPDIAFDKTTGAGFANNDTNALGGGHAHCGLAIYQSSLFPPIYRNQLLFGNLHGHRLVANYTDPKGSTYISKHAADFMRANDMHFIPVTQKVGPDGALYMSDWSDQQICHRGSNAVENWDRSNGRIYRISYGSAERSAGTPARFDLSASDADSSARFSSPFNLAKVSDEMLAKSAVQTENEWLSRMARRLLTERAATDTSTFERMVEFLSGSSQSARLPDVSQSKVTSLLREAWLFHSTGSMAARNVEVGYHALPAPDPNEGPEHWRAACVRSYDSPVRFLDMPQEVKDRIENSDISRKEWSPYLALAAEDRSPLVRRELASLLQRIVHSQRTSLATALLKHGEDKDDPMIPLLIWYGIEPLVAADPAAGMRLAKASKLEKVTGFIYRRLSAEPEGRNTLLRALAGVIARPAPQPDKGESQSTKGGVGPQKGGSQSPDGGAQVPKGDAHSEKGGANSEKGGAHLQKGGGHSEKGGGDNVKGGVHHEKVGTPIVKVGAPFQKVGAHPEKVGAPIAKVGTPIVMVGAPIAAKTVDYQSFTTAEKESILASVVGAARGAGKLTPPADWPAIAAGLRAGATPRTLSLVRELAALFGDAGALGEFRTILADAKQSAVERQTALSLLIQSGDAATAPVLRQMLAATGTPAGLRRQAIQALASIKDAETPAFLGGLLPKLPANELPDAINTLASTKEGAKALLKAVEAKQVPATALSPFLVRQLVAFDDPEVAALIKSAWGDVNAPKADLGVRTKKYRDLLTPAALAKADATKGKLLYMGTCGACHKLLGEGQNVGPDITGSNRADLNYLLENVLDPNAVIGKDYQLQLFTMTDGRVMGGVVKEENAATVKVAMMGGIEFTLAKADVKKREVSKMSTMPEGLFDALQPEQVVDLVKYLQSSVVPASAGQNPAKAGTTKPGVLEGEALKVLSKTGGNTRIQGMGGFGNKWSGGSQLWWTGGKPDQKLTLAIPVKEAGKYQLHGVLTMARDYGVISITLDGKPVASTFDGYHADKVILTDELDWGTHDLTAGEHKLTFTLAPPNPAAAPGNMVGVDYVRLEKK